MSLALNNWAQSIISFFVTLVSFKFINGDWIHMIDDLPFSSRETTFVVTPDYFPAHQTPSERDLM